ncbi:MAG TPA: ADOP family duplicated permease, partial [Vicinamibacterales bacterium]|nr:ADOP family duplicated permease [Vicinamibacterales bacterium]
AYWRRHGVLAAAVVATVALGVGAATAVYAVVEAVIVGALPVREPGRLVWMWNARVERDRAPFSALDLADYREQSTVLDGLAPFVNWAANLTGLGDAERLEGIRVGPGFFDVLGVTAAFGRTLSSPGDDRAQVAVLTERLWRRRFGADPAIVGQTISLNGAGYTIVGVLPAGFVFPFRDAELAVPLVLEVDPRRSDRGAGFLRVVARLKPGMSLQAAKANLDAIGTRLRRDYPQTNAKKLGVNLFPLDREIVGDARALLLTLLAAVTLLVFVACANIANMFLVSMTARRRELSLRAALGATRTQLAFQLLGEVTAVVGAGGVAGLFVGQSLAGVLVWWGGTTLPRLDDVGLSPGVTAFAIATTMAAALLCGVMPAWLFSNVPAVGLVDEGRGSTGGLAQGRFRRAFVAGQVAAALMLLVAVLLTVRSFRQLQAVRPGFDGRNVLSVQLALPPSRYAKPSDIIAFADKFAGGLAELQGVREAAAISLLPLSGLLSTQDYRIVGDPDPPADAIPQAHYRVVTPGYFRVMGVAIRGREFDDGDREATRRVAVISRTFADRHWRDRSPIGAHIVIGPDALEVVGVCDDVQQFGLDAGPTADVYVPLRQMPAGQAQFVTARMYWVIRTADDPLKSADAIRAVAHRLDKDVAASSTRSMPQVVAASIGSRRFTTDLMTIAGAASLLLAVIGVYSVTAFSMARRTREIGIRLMIGARPAQVILPAVAGEWPAIAAGLVVGALGAVVVARLVSPIVFAGGGESAVIGGAAVALGIAALLASYLPAARAVRGDPVAALRED